MRRIKPSTIDEWIGQMIEEGKSRSVIVETLGVLRRILNRAVRDKAFALRWSLLDLERDGVLGTHKLRMPLLRCSRS